MMNDSEAAIHSLWACLPRIRQFAFRASNGPGSATDWNGRGEGRVQVTPWQDGWCFEEAGHYVTPQGQRLAMRNRYGWQRGEGGIRLCHLRYASPVPLFELRPVTMDIWQSSEPHLCGADRYQARLLCRDDGFDLSWQIQGPRKNEQLAYCYRIAETKKPAQGAGEGTIGGLIPK